MPVCRCSVRVVVSGFSRTVGHLDIDERAQAVVLAEIAARRLVSRRSIRDPPNGVEPDEARAVAGAVQTARLHGRADGARLAAMLVDDDLGLDVRAAEVRSDEI